MILCSRIVFLLWGVHMLGPLQQFQGYRWTLAGHEIPAYYFLVSIPLMAAAALLLALKRRWSRWELLWWLPACACLPGVLFSGDIAWSFRQWSSLLLRGIGAGGILFATLQGFRDIRGVRKWIYPVVVASACYGLLELVLDRNILYDYFRYPEIPAVADSSNPVYRPYRYHHVSARPTGTQGNRIPYLCFLNAFLPLALWEIKYGKWKIWAWLGAGAIYSVIVLGGSQSAWVGLLVSLGAWTALNRQKYFSRKVAAGVLAATCLLLAIWVKMPARSESSDVVPTLSSKLSNIRHRLDSFATATAVQNRWLIGVGYGQYPNVYRPYYKGPYPGLTTPDNQFLRWFIETGLLGITALSVLFYGIVRAGLKRVSAMKETLEADFYKALLAGWGGIAAAFFFFDGFYWGVCNMTFWSMLGLFATCLKRREI